MFRMALVACLLVFPTAASAQSAHLCTGLGQDAREEAEVFPHTLKLVFAARGGAYVGDVAVRIETGGAVVFEGICDGPWLLLNLDPGRYRITSSFEGQSNTFDIRLGKRTIQRTVVFRAAR